MPVQSLVVPETSRGEILRIFELQKSKQFELGNTTAKQRRAKLKKLHEVFLKYRPQIKEVLYKDFGKHPSEVDLSEVYPVTSEIKHVRKNLNKWMDRKSVATPISLLGSSSFIKYEPKGVVLIISPWNFPFNLTFGPLVTAIAAGNAVIIKPSEMTPNASGLMKKIIAETFEEHEVALVEGGIETSTELLALPFNHIFFTGAPKIGKIVMAAAAKNLASVTLELGGKSPTIIDKTADLKTAAKRITWGKFMNNGQVCIAPDYVFVHNSRVKEFTKLIEENVTSFYSKDVEKAPSYARIVNARHTKRLKDSLQNSLMQSGTVELGGVINDDDNYISPTVVSDLDLDSDLMKNEIFGPIMPVIGFDDLQEVVDHVNANEKPLALYIYSKSKKNINFVLDNTRAGGGCINHNAVHFFNENLPFGGVNNSGIGKGHGWFGFQAFSNARGILQQHVPNALDMLLPPYDDFKQKLIDLTIKYF